MKRLFLTVMAVLSMTMTFAENEELNTTNTANAYKMTVNYSRLADALCLSIDQLEAVQDIHSEFCADMMNAGNANADERKPMVEKALQKDLKHMEAYEMATHLKEMFQQQARQERYETTKALHSYKSLREGQ